MIARNPFRDLSSRLMIGRFGNDVMKYSVSSPIFVDGNGTIYNSEGKERPSYKNCRIYLNNTLDPTVPDWVKLNSTTYMARYAYVISPLSDKIRLVVASGGGPMLKYIVMEDDFRYVTTTMNKGEQLTYVLILANTNKRGIQKLELAYERKCCVQLCGFTSVCCHLSCS